MAKGHKPVAGSRAFWPRKRANRIYQTIRTAPVSGQASPLSFAGYKAGMASVVVVEKYKGPKDAELEREAVRPVTVLDSPPLSVCGIRAYTKDAYGMKCAATVWSEALGKDLSRAARVPKKPATKEGLASLEGRLDSISDIRLLVHTRPRETGHPKKKPEIFEVLLGGHVRDKFNYAKERMGGDLRASEIFQEGEMVDARAVSTGKGYTGPVKRFGVKIRPRKHEKKRRHVGNIGAYGPSRVFPGKIAFPGQHGFQTRTEYNKMVLGIRNGGDANPSGGFVNYGLVKGDYLLLAGSVPGPRKRLIMLRKGIRPGRKALPVVKKIITASQQGV
jgi:large subunit ribosomal protein L3